MIYMSCLYRSHHNKYNEYNFLVLLAEVTKNDIKIYVIQIVLKKTIVYMTYLYKSM